MIPMKTKLMIMICFVFSVAKMNAQEFVERYDSVTIENLPQFMDDWAKWSKKVAKNAKVSVWNELLVSDFNRLRRETETENENDVIKAGTKLVKYESGEVEVLVDDECDEVSMYGLATCTLEDLEDEEYSIFTVDQAYEDSLRNSFKYKHKYIVLPQYVDVVEYADDPDPWLWHFYGGNELVDSITPVLPDCKNVLYSSSAISRKLSAFLGGKKVKVELPPLTDEEEFDVAVSPRPVDWREITPVNTLGELMLNAYVPVAYGHWGGYWHFGTMPYALEIKYSKGAAQTDFRTSWFSGTEISHEKIGDKVSFSVIDESSWME